MDTKYTNPIKAGIFDEEGNPFSLLNPVPVEISNFPADYALPAAQFNALNQEATQELIRLLLVSLDGKFNSLGQKASADSHPVVLSTEQEVILDAIKTAVQNLDLDIEDIATEATLSAINAKLNSLGQKASAASAPVVLSSEQEVILDAIRIAVQNLDLDIEDIATEATLAALRTDFNNEDFATETTLAALSAKFNSLGQKASAASHPVVLSTEQEAIFEAIKNATESSASGLATEATLSALRTDFNNEDFATQTTLAALLAAFNAEDFASQTTLAALLAAFNAEDFASETTLVNLNAKVGSHDLDLGAGTEDRLRSEYLISLQSIANIHDGIGATQYPNRYESNDFKINGFL